MKLAKFLTIPSFTEQLAATVFFAAIQLNIQCYNEKCRLQPEIVMEIL